MKPGHVRFPVGFVTALMGLVLIVGIVLAWQREQTHALRASLAVAQMEASELAALRVENQRLLARQIPRAELDQLRADHAALPRLRAELEALKSAAPASNR